MTAPTIKNWWQDFGSPYPSNHCLRWCDSDQEDNVRPGTYGVNDITYEFNELGLRSRPLETVPDRINILVSGCSHTMGIGLPLEHTWPQQLENLIPGSVVHNVAIGGASTDYVVRSIFLATGVIQADLIFVLWPHSSRLEYFDRTGPRNLLVTAPAYPKILLDDVHHFNNYMKNLIMLQMVAGHTPLYHGTEDLSRSPDGVPTARDGLHNCSVWHRRMALAFFTKLQQDDRAQRFSTAQHILEHIGLDDY